MTLFIAPYTVLIPPNNRYRVALLHVPMDDTHTMFHFIAFGGETTPDQESWRKFNALQVGIDVDEMLSQHNAHARTIICRTARR